MADATYTQGSVRKQIAGGKALVVAIEIESLQNVEGYKLLVGVVMTGRQPREADTDVDILKMPETYSQQSQTSFCLVSVDLLEDCSRIAPPGASQQSYPGLEEGHSGICCWSDRRMPRRRRYQSLTASADQYWDCWGLAILAVGIGQEAQLHIDVGRLSGKTYWRLWQSARSRFSRKNIEWSRWRWSRWRSKLGEPAILGLWPVVDGKQKLFAH